MQCTTAIPRSKQVMSLQTIWQTSKMARGVKEPKAMCRAKQKLTFEPLLSALQSVLDAGVPLLQLSSQSLHAFCVLAPQAAAAFPGLAAYEPVLALYRLAPAVCGNHLAVCAALPAVLLPQLVAVSAPLLLVPSLHQMGVSRDIHAMRMHAMFATQHCKLFKLFTEA